MQCVAEQRRPCYQAVLPAACPRESQAGTRAGEQHVGAFPLEHPKRRHLRDHHQINPRLSLRCPALIPALQQDGAEVSPACSRKPLPGHRDGLEMGLTGSCSRSNGLDPPGELPGMFVEPFLPVLRQHSQASSQAQAVNNKWWLLTHSHVAVTRRQLQAFPGFFSPVLCVPILCSPSCCGTCLLTPSLTQPRHSP